MTPQDAFAWMNENMLPYYPLGVYKDVVAEGHANAAEAGFGSQRRLPHRAPRPAGGRRCTMSRSVNMVLAGFGGQGVLFAGKLIAYAGLLEDREVSWLAFLRPRDARRHRQLQRVPVRTIPSEARSCSPPTCSLP